jgi:hypothetical protein
MRVKRIYTDTIAGISPIATFFALHDDDLKLALSHSGASTDYIDRCPETMAAVGVSVK